MRKLRCRLRSCRGFTLVETMAAAAVLALLALMLHTGLLMAQRSYVNMTGAAERQLLLSTLGDLLSNELRYARDVVAEPGGRLERYTSVNYGRNTILSLSDGQLAANGLRMLSTGAYGNGAYTLDTCAITYDSGTFQVALEVSGWGGSDSAQFSVRCLNPT